MSYCIISVVYGTFIDENVNQLLEKLNIDAEEAGFETLYSGSSTFVPGYCGVELCEFDESNSGLSVTSLNIKPTQKQKQTAQKLYKSLDSRVKKVAPKIGVYLVFHTS